MQRRRTLAAVEKHGGHAYPTARAVDIDLAPAAWARALIVDATGSRPLRSVYQDPSIATVVDALSGQYRALQGAELGPALEMFKRMAFAEEEKRQRIVSQHVDDEHTRRKLKTITLNELAGVERW